MKTIVLSLLLVICGYGQSIRAVSYNGAVKILTANYSGGNLSVTFSVTNQGDLTWDADGGYGFRIYVFNEAMVKKAGSKVFLGDVEVQPGSTKGFSENRPIPLSQSGKYFAQVVLIIDRWEVASSEFVSFDYGQEETQPDLPITTYRPLEKPREEMEQSRSQSGPKYIGLLNGTIQSVDMGKVNTYLKYLFPTLKKEDKVNEAYGFGGMLMYKTGNNFSWRPRFEWGTTGTDFNFRYNYGYTYTTGKIDIDVSYTMYGLDALFGDDLYFGIGVGYLSGEYKEKITLLGQTYNDTSKGSAMAYDLIIGGHGDLSKGSAFFLELYYRMANITELKNPYGQTVLLTSSVPFELNYSGIGITGGIAFGGK